MRNKNLCLKRDEQRSNLSIILKMINLGGNIKNGTKISWSFPNNKF